MSGSDVLRTREDLHESPIVPVPSRGRTEDHMVSEGVSE
jgi:hypothetical protein